MDPILIGGLVACAILGLGIGTIVVLSRSLGKAIAKNKSLQRENNGLRRAFEEMGKAVPTSDDPDALAEFLR